MMAMSKETPVQVPEQLPLRERAVHVSLLAIADMAVFLYAAFVVWLIWGWLIVPLIADPAVRILYVLIVGRRVAGTRDLISAFEGYMLHRRETNPNAKADLAIVLASLIAHGSVRVVWISVCWLIAWLLSLAV